MGCDIHLYVEKRIDGKWVAQGNFERDEDGYMQGGDNFYSGRNYDLFAILADVRNGRGFAGVRTGDGFNPIADPRGIPDDASPEYKGIVEGWGVDGHSHSHLTLRELLEYDWTQATGKQGWVDFKAWERWTCWKRGNGEGPDDYCGAVSGGAVSHVTAARMDAMVDEYRKLDRDQRDKFQKECANTYALAEWATPYYRAADSFLSETISRLVKLAGGLVGVDDVRIVFFFDN